MTWDTIQREYIFSHGCEIDNNGIIKIPRFVWSKQVYRGINADTGVKNWMIPSIRGCCLIFEHTHFEII